MPDNRFAGKIKWFNETKGYGFIIPDTGGSDVFVHISAVSRSGLSAQQMADNTAVTYELETRHNKTTAANIRLG